MSATPQSAAIQVVNQLSFLANQILNAYDVIAVLEAQWTEQGIANQINAFPTAALNTDGSLGTADVTPNVAHPFDNRVNGFTGIGKALSSNQYTSIKTLLDAVKSLVDGNAVSAQTGAHSILNQARGG